MNNKSLLVRVAFLIEALQRLPGGWVLWNMPI